MYSRCRWDSRWIVRKYKICGIKIGSPGSNLPAVIQHRARKLLLKIGEKDPNFKFEGIVQNISPSLDFFLSKTLFKMAVRFVYAVGVRQFSYVVTSTVFPPLDGDGKEILPLHILSFAGAFVCLQFCFDGHL